MPEIKKNKDYGAGRKVLYPDYKSTFYYLHVALTVNAAREGLGWIEETPENPFGEDYLLKDRFGKKIRCSNNIRNRPLYMSIVEAYVQDILRGKWRRNCEPIIIGRTGIVVNGQHQLVALIIADQDRQKSPKYYKHWIDKECTLEKLVVYGCEETDEVINTMDTCKPRSLADVIYRSEYFANENEGTRKVAARMTDHAIRLLWQRTGVFLPESSFSPRRTHSEACDFLERHRRLLKCIKHIQQENKKKSISDYVTAGYAAGMMYLMACSSSVDEDYYIMEDHSEKKLKWDHWDLANTFWSEFATRKKEKTDDVPTWPSLVKTAITSLGEGRRNEKLAVLCKAWKAYIAGGEMTKKDLQLKFTPPDENQIIHMEENPDVGGIDLGVLSKKKPIKDSTDPTNENDHEPETEEEVAEIEKRKEEVSSKKSTKKGKK